MRRKMQNALQLRPNYLDLDQAQGLIQKHIYFGYSIKFYMQVVLVVL